MSTNAVELIEPIVELKSEFFTMVEEFKVEGTEAIAGIGSIETDDFDNSVRRAKEHIRGIGLPQGWVSCNTYWLICKGRIIGTCELRHRLTEALREYGGHIGYSIRPSERRKGYCMRMFDFVLQKAQALGIERVLVTCGDDNIASARVIEKNGGRLADKIASEHRDILTRRYWIELNRSRKNGGKG